MKADRLKTIGIAFLCSALTACDLTSVMSSVHEVKPKEEPNQTENVSFKEQISDSLEPDFTIPAYTDSPYTVINDNVPYFMDAAYDLEETAYYSELDELGRAGSAYALLSRDTMPTGKRDSIGMIQPSGWQTVRYDDLIEDKYLYNRCHLIGYQLAGGNDNEKNLITGTRYLNVEGMLPFENQVADYIEHSDNRVLYRVTPVFWEDELVARGVLMEAKSIEDDKVCFNVFVHNVQPGITINYLDGTSYVTEVKSEDVVKNVDEQPETITFVVNRNTDKFHSPDCSSVSEMKQKYRWDTTLTAEELVELGYSPCQNCKPAGMQYVEEQTKISAEETQGTELPTYVVNTNTKKFHYANCASVSTIKDKNRADITASRDELISRGYSPCKRCHP